MKNAIKEIQRIHRGLATYPGSHYKAVRWTLKELDKLGKSLQREEKKQNRK